MSDFELTETEKTLADKLFAYEDGELESEEEFVELFQELVDCGWAWTLQGHYGRIAMSLIEAGLVTVKSQEYVYKVIAGLVTVKS